MIKPLLKRNNLPLAQVASDLGISRPTLDNYIDLYAKGEGLPNQIYQNIFDFLFSDAQISDAVFLEKYDYVKETYGKPSIGQMPLSADDETENLSYTTNGHADSVVQVTDQDHVRPRNVFDEYLLYKQGQKKIGTVTLREKKLFSVIFSAEYEMDVQGDFQYDEKAFDSFVSESNARYAKENGEGGLPQSAKDLIAKLTAGIEEGRLSAKEIRAIQALLDEKE